MTTPSLVLYDDVDARHFAPFALTRPLAYVRAGAELIYRRWPIGDVRFSSSPHLDTFREQSGPAAATGVLSPGTILANARCVLPIDTRLPIADVWRVNDQIAAVRLTKPLPVEALHDGSLALDALELGTGTIANIHGRWLTAPWDLVSQLGDQLMEDAKALVASVKRDSTASVSPIGTHAVVIEPGAIIEPHVVFDASAGPIVVRTNAHVNAFSRIAGPCVIGAGTHILGGRISGSAIGDQCRVHGDMSASLMFGYANKAHEGFVGHTVIGCWANLGAGTTTSNLKNSYGPVKLWTPEGDRDTGLTFLGSLIGDHAKLGIGTMLGTGTVVSAGANVFGTMRPPKRVPPFAWGDAPPYETFSLEKFLEVAGRVMQRRNIALDDATRRALTAAHELGATDDW